MLGKQHNVTTLVILGLLGLTSPLLAEKAENDGETKIALFNGHNLDGWVTEGGAPVGPGWVVEDGVLTRGPEKGGTIYAEGEYANFILEFEWRLALGGNSGVKYRVRHWDEGIRGKPGWLGFEYQLLDDVNHPQADVFATSTGSLYVLVNPGRNKRLNPPDEFNHSRIVVCGTRIEHWLNGQRIVTADTRSTELRDQIAASKFSTVDGFGMNREGRIQIQDHGSQVWFRNITLQPIEAKPVAPTSNSRRRSGRGLFRRSRRPLSTQVTLTAC